MKAIEIIKPLPIVAALWLVVPAALAVDTNCTDPEVLAGWQTLLQRYPHDHDLRELYHLREQLCVDLGPKLGELGARTVVAPALATPSRRRFAA